MTYREIGNSKIKASIIGLGTWAIGGGTWWGDTDDAQSIKTIQAAIDSGTNLIDTAPAYGFGRSEEVVGKAIKDRRSKAVLSTKCGLWWNTDEGSPFFEIDGRKVNRSLMASTIRQEIEMSLKRLDTDYIDIYHTHWQAIEPCLTPISETMECLMALKKEGKIRSIAVSNATPEQMDEYQKYGELDANQPRYSMLDRAIEADLVPYCIKNNISILAYSPLEQGLLTGKIGMDYKISAGEARNNISWFEPDKRKLVIDMLAGWENLTKKYSCTLSQLVIAWTVAQPGITHALCGARKLHQIEENSKAGELVLETADIACIRADVERLG